MNKELNVKIRMNYWRTTDGNHTHLLLDGGTLYVPEDEEPAFFRAYVSEILEGRRLYIVEQKTPVFKFFVDVDFTSETDELDFVKLSECLHEIVDIGPCVVSKATPRKMSDGKTKYGLHIIWQNSEVTKQKAQGLRMKILLKMGSEWEKIIDPNVYSGSGLRMLWSHKNEAGSTVYVPWGKIEDGTFVEFTDNTPTPEFLKMFSIISRNKTPPSTKHEEQLNINVTDIESFIRKNVKGQERTKVMKISKCGNKKDFWVRTNSRYCENVSRCHKSNHVWFCINTRERLLYQKCQDDDCKNFTGTKYRIPSHLIPNERILDNGSHRIISDYLPDGWKWKGSFNDTEVFRG